MLFQQNLAEQNCKDTHS